MDEGSGNTEPGSSEVSRKRTRGPTLCKKLKKRITNQNLECTISFNEFGRPIGDMLKDFRIYLGSVVRCQVDINIESWDLVNQGLKDAIWDDIKNGMEWIAHKTEYQASCNESVSFVLC
ncbi:hypothetical protein POM88_027547 [Heracleum sosnowskyi]|uniref:Uncharacterized protein n=1 Tax=Heracleum sosnowskyi TaxID=360622 RepID=A0AAD8IAD1_9APIA|nr:hypothetical protein POM88_027547 [Heracleum sosnowskyi]